MSSIAENLSRVEDALATACRKAGRSREGVRLMAVSKTHPIELLLEAAAAGHRLFGENRVQEFSEKSQVLSGAAFRVALLHYGSGRAPGISTSGTIIVTNQERGADEHSHSANLADLSLADPSITDPALALPTGGGELAVHLIGHLQSNKAGRAAEIFSAIDTVDSLKLAERLHAQARQLGRRLPVLLEIKLSEEETKEGIAPDSDGLAQLLERLPDLGDHLPLDGLMTVAPISENPAVARACFQQLRALRDKLAPLHPHLCFDELSMGMSGDFAEAIKAGSTTVRIGTAIFGARPKR